VINGPFGSPERNSSVSLSWHPDGPRVRSIPNPQTALTHGRLARSLDHQFVRHSLMVASNLAEEFFTDEPARFEPRLAISCTPEDCWACGRDGAFPLASRANINKSEHDRWACKLLPLERLAHSFACLKNGRSFGAHGLRMDLDPFEKGKLIDSKTGILIVQERVFKSRRIS